MKQAIVFGAMGFVGFNLSCHLLEEGTEVIGIRNPLIEKHDKLLEQKMLHIGRNANFHLLELEEDSSLISKGDFNTSSAIYYCLFDPTIHIKSVFNQHKYLEKSLTLLTNVINFCARHKCKLILISTLDMFNRNEQIINEETEPTPKSLNGLLHHREEILVMNKGNDLEFPYIIVRLPTLYGPWQPMNMVFQHGILTTDLHSDQPTIHEDTSDVLYINDVLNSLYVLGSNKISNEIIHFASGNESEWFNGYKLIYEQESSLRNEYKCPTLDTTKVRQLLNFYPQTTIGEGIKKQKAHTKKLMKHFI
ncbi:NAD(P)-dependent oxidoreductase [Cytobacillus sp. IB215665]|uniref:NAD-dependent epimerase/dehydratase family protein n=1 Tax=Cytobacillus sp. IB215665 TaxID=3097357 RepID=UPI002A0F58BB|nr:NAD(P)-dependent oxidoreductase [Cytobacillus sp. IB215665]MDX8364457.1 NAD(P)-dependent oxidoreductase [Cytobacillus sp. IB215665]